jgi:hypothetical protein
MARGSDFSAWTLCHGASKERAGLSILSVGFSLILCFKTDYFFGEAASLKLGQCFPKGFYSWH